MTKKMPLKTKSAASVPIPFDNMQDSAVMKKAGVLEVLPWSMSTLNKRIKHDPNFPKRIKLGERAVGFRVGDVRIYLASLEVKS